MTKSGMKTILSALLIICFHLNGVAQQLLQKTIPSLEINRQPLGEVLEILSNKGDFYFSYNSNTIKKDSLVSLKATNKTIREILDMLFKPYFEYKESGNYIILRRVPVKLTLITNSSVSEDRYYSISGYVLDQQTGTSIPYASIYEQKWLASSLTNDQGYFKIKLKSRYRNPALTVSKEFYEDTTVPIKTGYNQQLTITIVPIETFENTYTVTPDDYFAPDSITLITKSDSFFTKYTYRKTDSVKVEKTRIAGLLLSAKQKIQSVNLKKFFVARPYQVSFFPPLSTNGRLNAQVVNKFSVNALGGYSAGVNGVEFGGLFNINKKNMQGMQAAGIFNLAGGYVKGAQFAGVNNTVLDSMHGFEAAGVGNFVKRKVTGWQVAGVYNYAADSAKGVQISGVVNVARKTIHGVQISGVVNYARKIKGAQIGVINIADSSSGLHIGIINIVKNGYHTLALSANELMNLNVEIKTGTKKLYSNLIGGMNISDTAKLYSFGFGLGHYGKIGRNTGITTEISSQYLYRGSWDYTNLLNKFKLNFNIHLGKYISVFAGPVVNVFYTDQQTIINNYHKNIPSYKTHRFSDKVTGWIGWNAGISIF